MLNICCFYSPPPPHNLQVYRHNLTTINRYRSPHALLLFMWQPVAFTYTFTTVIMILLTTRRGIQRSFQAHKVLKHLHLLQNYNLGTISLPWILPMLQSMLSVSDSILFFSVGKKRTGSQMLKCFCSPRTWEKETECAKTYDCQRIHVPKPISICS